MLLLMEASSPPRSFAGLTKFILKLFGCASSALDEEEEEGVNLLSSPLSEDDDDVDALLSGC